MSYNPETKMWEGYIYKIWNDVNSKLYIGQTISTIHDRWHGHMSAAISKRPNKSILYRAMNKYGRESFHIEMLEMLTAESKEDLIKALNQSEQQYIMDYHTFVGDPEGPGYNTERGGANKCVPGQRVCKYDDNLNLLETYDSIMDASRLNNIDNATIWAVCKHYYYRAAGFIWAYEGEEPQKPKPKTKPKSLQKEKKPKRVQYKKKPTLTPEEKKAKKLEQLKWNGKRIVVYNSFEQIIAVYEDIIDASVQLNLSIDEIKKNLDGRNLCHDRIIIRYEGDPFDKYPRSPRLQAVTLYDLQGNKVADFETILDAEKYMGVCRGELLKVMKRGGSCCSYLISFYGKPLERKLQRWDKQVAMKDSEGNVIKTFQNKNLVSLYLGLSDCHQGLNQAIKKHAIYYGYYWEEIEEYKVS